jgi:hypothetical protein
MLAAVKAWKGSRYSALHLGLATGTAATLVALLLLLGGAPSAAALSACAVLGWTGLFFYEQAYIRAGQLPPLS